MHTSYHIESTISEISIRNRHHSITCRECRSVWLHGIPCPLALSLKFNVMYNSHYIQHNTLAHAWEYRNHVFLSKNHVLHKISSSRPAAFSRAVMVAYPEHNSLQWYLSLAAQLQKQEGCLTSTFSVGYHTWVSLTRVTQNPTWAACMTSQQHDCGQCISLHRQAGGREDMATLQLISW